jgi:DNA polymerase
MSDRRTEIRRELGLLPVWRRRAVSPVAAGAGTGSPDAAAPVAAGSPAAAAGPDPAAAAAPPADPRGARILRMSWDELRAAVDSCRDCGLCETRNKTAFGVGDPRAAWLFVGEGPGAEEDAKGEPFVGQAGRLLDNMLAAIGLARGNDVYIANIVKCRPPGNRTPQPAEARTCEPYLQRQIELIGPKLIVALGKTAAVHLLGREASIASLRGKVHAYRGMPLIVTYHPAYLLRSLPEKARAWEDLVFMRRQMRELVERAGRAASA